MATTLALDTEDEPCICSLYDEIRKMDATDMIRLTWGGEVVARVIVGG
jgi:hypothetical protein